MQLFINTRGTSLRRKGDRFLISRRGAPRPIEVSAHKVQSLVVATGVNISSQAVQLATEQNIDVVFLDRSGRPTARIWQCRMGSTAQIRRRQLEIAETNEALVFVRQWTTAKLENQRDFLQELKRRRPERASLFETPLATLENCLEKVAACRGTVDQQRGTLMGLEGAAGRAYFRCLGRLVPAEYRFETRSRQPAVDPFNAMLNYSYGVLYSLVERALILAGLDSFVGFLHTDNYNKRSLVFDMIEPFRILGERTTVRFFTGRRAKQEYFRDVPGGVELSPDGRAALMEVYNKRLERAVRYPVQGPSAGGAKPKEAVSAASPIPAAEPAPASSKAPAGQRKRKRKYRRIAQRAVIQHEAHALANVLLGRQDLPKIVETEKVFAEQEDAKDSESRG